MESIKHLCFLFWGDAPMFPQLAVGSTQERRLLQGVLLWNPRVLNRSCLPSLCHNPGGFSPGVKHVFALWNWKVKEPYKRLRKFAVGCLSDLEQARDEHHTCSKLLKSQAQLGQWERLNLWLYFHPFVQEGRGQLFRCPRLWVWVLFTGMMRKSLVVEATVAALVTSPLWPCDSD